MFYTSTTISTYQLEFKSKPTVFLTLWKYGLKQQQMYIRSNYQQRVLALLPLYRYNSRQYEARAWLSTFTKKLLGWWLVGWRLVGWFVVWLEVNCDEAYSLVCRCEWNIRKQSLSRAKSVSRLNIAVQRLFTQLWGSRRGNFNQNV